MTKKSVLIKALDKVADKTLSSLLQTCTPIPINDRIIMVGNSFVRKNNNKLYDVLSMNKNVIYCDLVTLDIAVIVAEKYSSGKISDLKKVISLEQKYSKYFFDMLNYLHCIKNAKKNKDLERYLILTDKYNEAKIMASTIKENILVFK